MYPGLNNADLSHTIDSRIESNNDIFEKWANFVVPMFAEYKNKDKHFTAWITKGMPAWLDSLESGMKAHKGKFLCGKELSIADLNTYSVFFKIVTNDKFEHNLICQAIVDKYPKVKAWHALMDETFED